MCLGGRGETAGVSDASIPALVGRGGGGAVWATAPLAGTQPAWAPATPHPGAGRGPRRGPLELDHAGLDHLCFTGREATLPQHFSDIGERTDAAGYAWSSVSNGSTFPRLVPLLVHAHPWFRDVTFSLDGAREATHDRLRRPGA
jgi:hypothetical protein